MRLWDSVTGQPIGNPMNGHNNFVSGVAFGPDGSRIASSSYDATVRLWDTATGEPVGGPLTGPRTGRRVSRSAPTGVASSRGALMTRCGSGTRTR